MKKSLLTLITLLNGAYMLAPAATTAPSSATQVITLTPGATTSSSSSTSSNTPFPGTGHTLGNQTVTKNSNQTDLNYALQNIIRKAVPNHSVTSADEGQALQAAKRAFEATKVSRWKDLTNSQLETIGKEALIEAINSLSSSTQIKATQNELRELANITAPTWAEENLALTSIATGLAVKVGYDVLQATKNENGSFDSHKAMGTAGLLTIAGLTIYNFGSIKKALKKFNADVQNFGRDTMNWVKSLS